MTDGTDWRYIERISRLVVKRRKRLSQLLAAGVIVVLLCWVLGGIVLPFAFSASGEWLAGAADFGDMFGAVNSLFSAFALIGVIAALMLQLQDLRESKDIAQKVALVQSHVTLADFRYRLLSSLADHRLRRGEKLRAEYHAKRALDLMRALGEPLSAKHRLDEVPFDADGGRVILHEIAWTLGQYAWSRGSKDNAKTLELINTTAMELVMWINSYGSLYSPEALEIVTGCRDALLDLPIEIIQHPSVGGKMAEWVSFWEKLASIAMRILTREDILVPTVPQPQRA